jgi:hypothetical protein
MSQPFLNWPESPTALEPLIRQIVQEELTKLVGSLATLLGQPAREHILPNTSEWSEKEQESHRQELKTFFAQFQADVTGYRFNREEANER